MDEQVRSRAHVTDRVDETGSDFSIDPSRSRYPSSCIERDRSYFLKPFFRSNPLLRLSSRIMSVNIGRTVTQFLAPVFINTSGSKKRTLYVSTSSRGVREFREKIFDDMFTA